MLALYFALYLLAGVFFGLAAGRVQHRIDFTAAGLFCWVLVEAIQSLLKL